MAAYALVLAALALSVLVWLAIPDPQEARSWSPPAVRPEIAWCADCEAPTTVTLTGQCARCSSEAILVTQRPRPIVLSPGPPIVLDEAAPFSLDGASR